MPCTVERSEDLLGLSSRSASATILEDLLGHKVQLLGSLVAFGERDDSRAREQALTGALTAAVNRGQKVKWR